MRRRKGDEGEAVKRVAKSKFEALRKRRGRKKIQVRAREEGGPGGGKGPGKGTTMKILQVTGTKVGGNQWVIPKNLGGRGSGTW